MERRNSAHRNSKGELSTEVQSSWCASQAPGRGGESYFSTFWPVNICFSTCQIGWRATGCSRTGSSTFICWRRETEDAGFPERSRRGGLHHESCSARNRSTRAWGITRYKYCRLWNAPGSVWGRRPSLFSHILPLQNWVVSKFGRVLPVLQLRQQKGLKVRPLKYDPSKYSHNIRRLDQSGLEVATPVTGLTWELQGGDSDISRKRRGEFPPFQAVAPKRSCTDTVNDPGRAQTRWRKGRDQWFQVSARFLKKHFPSHNGLRILWSCNFNGPRVSQQSPRCSHLTNLHSWCSSIILLKLGGLNVVF